jgi:hypothetical protein
MKALLVGRPCGGHARHRGMLAGAAGTKALLVGVGALLLGGCAPASSAPTTPVSPSVVPSVSSSVSSVEPASSPSDYRVTFGFAVPSGVVRIPHPFTAPPLRTLVGVYAGNHPEGPFQRMSFYFRGGYPSYQVSYVPSVVRDPRGDPVSLPGNAFLQLVFTDATASVTASPPSSIGYQNLKGYAPAGDFEGHVTYGLGLMTRPNSDQALPVRLGELMKSDGAGGSYYVIFVDIQTA